MGPAGGLKREPLRLLYVHGDSDQARRLEDAFAQVSVRPRKLTHADSLESAGAALKAVRMLGEADLSKGSRIIMEKPFGTDLETGMERFTFGLPSLVAASIACCMTGATIGMLTPP